MPCATRRSIGSPRVARRSWSSGPEPDRESRRQAAVPHRIAARVLALLALLAMVGACSGDATPSGPGTGTGPPDGAISTLAGTSWIVVSVGGRPPVPGAVPTVRFEADRVGGTGGCNQYGGPYRFDPA